MKECRNCGSPVAGYSDYCNGLACEASRRPEPPDDVMSDYLVFKRTWPNAGWQLWQVVLALTDMKEQWPDLYEQFDGSIESLKTVFAYFQHMDGEDE